jgi:hypothetical protein
MKTKDYEVTDDYGIGDNLRGSILKVYVISKDVGNGDALVYHPKSKGECASIEFCKLNEDGLFVSVHEDSWANMDTVAIKRLKEVL